MNIHEEGTCIILPLYGNSETARELVEKLKVNLAHQPFHIVAVDDACPDESGEVLLSAARDLKIPCTLVKNPKNLGQHMSIFVGLKEARGSVLVIMDTDLQDPPEIVPELIEQLKVENASLVIACRNWDKRLSFRSLSSLIFKRCLLWMVHSRAPVGIGSFYAMRASARELLLKIPDVDPSLLPLLLVSRVSTSYHYYDRPSRPYGRSGYTLRSRFRYAIHVLRNVRKLRP